MIDKEFNEFDDFDFSVSDNSSDNIIEEFFALCDGAEEPWKKNFSYTSYKCKDVTYLIPKAEHSARLSIGRDLDISVDDAPSVSLVSDRSYLFVENSMCGRSLSLTLSEIECNCDDSHLFAALYKEGVPLALQTFYFCPEDSDFTLKIHCSAEYTFGRYFLLVCGASVEQELYPNDTMGENVRYTFSLLQHGTHLQPPKVKSLSMKKRKDDASGNVSLRLTFGKPDADAGFTFYCVSDSYEPMGDADKYLRADTRKSSVSVELLTTNIWVAGNYRLYMLHNGEPFSMAEIHYDGELFSVLAVHELSAADDDYLFAKHMLFGSFAERWRSFASLPGYTACKKMIISRVRRLLMNKYRLSTNLRIVGGGNNYILDKMDKDFLRFFVPLVTPYDTYEDIDCLTFAERRSSADPYSEFNSTTQSYSCNVLVFYNLGAILDSSASVLIEKIVAWLGRGESRAIFLCGAPSETRMLLETYPSLAAFFPPENVVTAENYTLAEQVHFMQRQFEHSEFFPTSEAKKQLLAFLADARSRGVSTGWRAEELRKLFVKEIYPRICDRVFAGGECKESNTLRAISTVLPEDLQIAPLASPVATFDAVMSDLNAMVGLANLKGHFNLMFNNMRFHEMRRAAGLVAPAASAGHMIFTGNPGTGKTTVAKMVGKIFKSLGLLSKGEVIVTERTRIVGRYIGETESNMQHLLEQARGNVLFIDEAYTLCDGANDRKDFGAHVIDALLTVLSQPNPDILVVFAGYKKEMERMMLMNQGLEGRFPYKFHFDDYSADELMQIAEALFAKNDYALTASAREVLVQGIVEACSNKDDHFSNARWVGQLVTDGIIPAMSSRVFACGCDLNRETLTLVHSSDVAAALDRFGYKKSSAPQRHCIGFV